MPRTKGRIVTYLLVQAIIKLKSVKFGIKHQSILEFGNLQSQEICRSQ